MYNNTANNPGVNGGVAGFPNNGNPTMFIQIYGLNNFSTNVNEHAIARKIGLAVGGIGANPILCTPAG